MGPHIVPLSDGLDVIHNFITGSRIQPTSRLIKKENLRICNKCAGHAQPLFLTSTKTFLEGCTNNGVCMCMHTETAKQIINSPKTLFLGDEAAVM